MTQPQDPTPTPPDIGDTDRDRAAQSAFEASELAIALSHYDLGVIQSIRPLFRGSRRSPKVIIRAATGDYLLKRRAPGRDNPFRVAFTHSLQVYLTERGYPVPRLIGTRVDNNSMLQLHGTIYEMFVFVPGERYNHTAPAAHQAGVALGHLHRVMAAFRSEYEAPVGAYHGLKEIDAKIDAVPEAIAKVDSAADGAAVRSLCEELREAYHDAARRVEATGYARWTRAVSHGDWHPGNLIYRDRTVAAVLDFDSARVEPPMADAANALLQFSMRMGRMDDVGTWPVGLDMSLLGSFWAGYDQTVRNRPGRDERDAAPWLIVEALILESVLPVAATGSFGRVPGFAFLSMIRRTVQWVREHAGEMTRVLEPGA